MGAGRPWTRSQPPVADELLRAAGELRASREPSRAGPAGAGLAGAGPAGLSLAGALEAVDQAAQIIAGQAAGTDRAGVFPAAGVAALRDAGLMSAAISRDHGGHGFGAPALSEIAMRIGALCGSTAMIWAMHQIQLVCLETSAQRQPCLARYLDRAAREQLLIASITSEHGVGGNLRVSKAAVQRTGETAEIVKQAPTVSYAEAADSFLVTARRDPAAAPGDQVLVLVEAGQAKLKPTGVWDTMGMRGTVSGPHTLAARVPVGQILDEPFGQIAARRMVPVSHLLWSAVWSGIAQDAVQRAVRFARVRLRNSTAPPSPQLAWMHARGQMVQDSIRRFAADYAAEPGDRAVGVRANALKMQVSVDTVRMAEQALEVCGMAGYSEVGEFSVGRHLRDLYSARLMISNDRLIAVNAEMVAFGDL